MNTKKPKQNEIHTEYKSDKILVDKVFEFGQGHVFKWWDELHVNERRALLGQLRLIDFNLLKTLIDKHVKEGASAKPETATLKTPETIPIPQDDFQRKRASKAKDIGESAIRAGKTSVVTVAGGMGTRLGADRPKGMLSISPIMGKSIFQLHAEKILSNMKRYETVIPWYIMTSLNNDEMTREFFEEKDYFGLNKADVSFFTQDVLPVIDFKGKLLMDSKSSIVTSPNGHGGTLFALKEKGVLSNMKGRGIKHIFYHQIDNVLIKIIDPIFLGYHIKEGAKMSPKAVRKTYPEEKVGIIGIRNGHLDTIEYSELSEEDKHARNPNGTLKFGMGNPAIYLLDVDFVEKLNEGSLVLPYHEAVKKVPCIDEDGNKINPAENNAVKFEMFIFDALKYAGKSIIMEVLREDEFSPVKNDKGENSPETARQHMINQFGRWLREAGVEIPIDENGNVKGVIEISPLYALDAEELKNKVNKDLVFNGELNLQ